MPSISVRAGRGRLSPAPSVTATVTRKNKKKRKRPHPSPLGEGENIRLDEMHAAARTALDEIGALLKPRRNKPWNPRNAQGPSIRAFLWFRVTPGSAPGTGPRRRDQGRGRGGKISVGYYIVEHGPVFVIYGEPTRKGLDAVPLDRPILAVSINDLFDAHGRIRTERANIAATRLTAFYTAPGS